MSDNLGDSIDSFSQLLAYRDEPVHVVGAAAVEGAHLMLFFLEHGFTRLVGHDFAMEADFDRSFTRVQVGWPRAEREAMLARIRVGVELRLGERYLEGDRRRRGDRGRPRP